MSVLAGTHVVSSQVDLNKADMTLVGAGSASTIVQVSGTGYRLAITASGVTLQDLQIVKTDKTGGQDIIWINGSNVTIKNNTIHGQFVIGDGEIARAMVVSGGHSGLLIEEIRSMPCANLPKSLGQPPAR